MSPARRRTRRSGGYHPHAFVPPRNLMSHGEEHQGTMSLRTYQRRVLGVLALSLLASLGVASLRQGAVGTEERPGSTAAVQVGAQRAPQAFPRGIVVVGDSITARYDDEPGSPTQGWWSFVGRHFDTPVRTYAQSGSGYQRPGLHCTGETFVHRPAAFEGVAPSVFIVEGGRNDWSSCRQGRLVVSSDAVVQQAVTRYFRMLHRNLPDSTRIVVLGPPWGPRDPWQQRRITSIVHAAALREGLEYVSTAGTLDRPGRTIDGVHPTLSGSMALGDVVVRALEGPGTLDGGQAPAGADPATEARTASAGR